MPVWALVNSAMCRDPAQSDTTFPLMAPQVRASQRPGVTTLEQSKASAQMIEA